MASGVTGVIWFASFFGGTAIVGFKAERGSLYLLGVGEGIVGHDGRAVICDGHWDTGDIVAVVEFANIPIGIGLHFQDVIAAGQSCDINPLAGDIFGINVGPAALNSLVSAVIFAIGIRAG